MTHHHDSHTEADSNHEGGHVIPTATFVKVLITLFILTAITVGVAQINLGPWNILVAMLVASIKATLVILIFMHGLYENKIVGMYIVIPFVLLAIMISGIFLDNPFRIIPEPVKVEQGK